MTVCTEDDLYVRDRVRWVAVLSDGTNVYQDDERPGVEEPSAWKRMKAYCEENSLNIVELWLQFRSNRVLVEPKDADGYFFVKSAGAVWGNPETHHAYVVGPLVDGKIYTTTWKIPELVAITHDIRAPDFESPSLILKKKLTRA